MRITVASRIFAPEPAAASFRLAALAEALDDRGHQVTVLTTKTVSGEPARLAGSIRVRRAPVLRDSAGYVRGYLQYMSFDLPLFFRLLSSKRPDAVVVEPPPTTGFVVRLACALLRVPYVYYAADIWSDAAQSTGAPPPVVAFVRWLEARALRGAARVIAVSDGVAERVRELSGRSQVDVVANGINTDDFRPEGERVPDAPVAVYAGTTSEWQGADIFIRALPAVREQIPNARLHFVGQGSAWAELSSLADRLAPGQVTFTGVMPPAEAAVILRSARVGLVSLKPGQGYDFAIPTKIYASLACGTPVLFLGNGPAGDLIRENGLGIAAAWDVDAAARSLVSLLSAPPSPEDRARTASWALRNVAQSASARRAAAVVEAAR